MSDQHLIRDLESLSQAPDETADYAALARAGISRGQERIRRRRAISAVAVVAGLTAVAVGVTQLGPLRQPEVATTVATTAAADPGATTPVTSPSATVSPSLPPPSRPPAPSQPATSQPATSQPATSQTGNDRPGTLALGSVATFTYFSAQTTSVTVRQGNNEARFFEIGVRVCVLKVPPGSSTTTISPAPWSLAVTGGTAQKDGFEGGSGPDDLVETTVRAGDCVSGVVTFMVAPGAAEVNRVVYRNSLGETATWQVDRSTAAQPGSRLTIGQTATFTYFSATVQLVQTQQYSDGLLYGVLVTVCVNKVPSGSTTTISDDPWQLTLSKGTSNKDGYDGEPFGYGTSLPTKTVTQGECVSGIVTFLVIPGDARVLQIVYRNSLGESATWQV